MPTNTPDLEAEQAMIERAQANPQAFGDIFDTYYKTILSYATRRTGNVVVAQDIASEVFVKALNNIHAFKWRGVPISAWLYKIATNELRMYYRRSRYVSSLDEMREEAGFEPIDERDLVAEMQEAQDKIERHEQFIQARETIAHLPIKYQEVLVLRFGERKKISEIAQILGKREGTVKSLLSRALFRLRAEMTQPNQPQRIIRSEGHKPQDTL